MNRLSSLVVGVAAAVALVLPATAAIAPEMDGYRVEVEFSPAVARKLDQINRVEQTLEERFRKNRTDRIVQRNAGVLRMAKVQTEGTVWATERLIPDIKDFTVSNLVKALAADNINRANPGFRGTVRFRIDHMKVANHNVAFLSGPSTYVLGTVSLVAPDGKELRTEKISANLVVDHTVDTAYTGPKYAFMETQDTNRVGPALAYFVKKALERLWPDRKDRIYGPIIVRVSGPNEQIIQGSRIRQ